MSFQLIVMQDTFYGKDGKKVVAVNFFFPQDNICTEKFEYRFLLDRDVPLHYFLNFL